MNADDILNGILRITILISLVRPSEFTVITFEQNQEKNAWNEETAQQKKS